MNMNKHMMTITCTTACEVYSLTSKNYDRLVTKKNPALLDLLQKYVITKLQHRVQSVQGEHIPLIRHILFKLTEELHPTPRKHIPPLMGTKELPERDVLFEHQMDVFTKGKAEMVEPYVPGAIYYREIMREKAQLRDNVQRRKKLYQQTYNRRRSRKIVSKPRTMVAIKVALERESEIAEERERKRVIRAIREQQRLKLMDEFTAREKDLKLKIEAQKQELENKAEATKEQISEKEINKESEPAEKDHELEIYIPSLRLPPISESGSYNINTSPVQGTLLSQETEAINHGFDTHSLTQIPESPDDLKNQLKNTKLEGIMVKIVVTNLF